MQIIVWVTSEDGLYMTSHFFFSALPSDGTGTLPSSLSSFPLLSFFLIHNPSLPHSVQVPPRDVGHGWLWTPTRVPPTLSSCCGALVCFFPLSLVMDFPQNVLKSSRFGTAEFKPTGQCQSRVTVSTWDVQMDITSAPQLSKSPFLRQRILKRTLWILCRSSTPKNEF